MSLRRSWIKRRRPPADEQRLDELCTAVVWCRDGGRCARRGCEATQYTSVLDWAHVHTRGIKSLRWDPDNSMLLCKRCHMAWHGQIVVPGLDTGRHAWWTTQYPEREARLNMLLATRGRRIDKALIFVVLRRQFRTLTGRTWEGAA